jgi:tripartite-type tricarboxylate transporter receptor subunit TctC
LAVAPACLAEPALAEVPTIADTVPGYELSAWFGAGPTGAPPEIIQKLNQEINTGLAEPRIKARFDKLGAEPADDAR